ncbi:uncharacterized protein LOC106173195 isoform X1 [Lingula anatina]|uniref:Uncharacterized protein LOC106173195 isoform X1 n=1 Tax=Lingula anatina TaxID=7574 RepID=A0A1S3JHS9_LINAN|nr:uncharacterized protein LOC106173195 isoform X1 [Lingula anatina]|eukprot:XP_013409691.1 uncharacterized protein LOC106173195 isoform X1 [Lingula anatina]
MLVLWCHRNRTPVCIMSGDLMPIVHAVNEGFLDSPVADRNHSHRYEELMGESVSCPTCRGLGRVPRDHPSLNTISPEIVKTETLSGQDQTTVALPGQDQTMVTEGKSQKDPRGRRPKPPEEDETESFQIGMEIYDKIKQELKQQKVSQEVFAAVALGRTQGLLSDMLRKAEQGVPATASTRANLHQIEEFLRRPPRERQRLYKGYKMENREKRRMRREYYEDEDQPAFKKRTMISAHANAVMMQYYEKVSDTPDDAGLDVMAEVLNLDRDVIEKFFKNERKKKSQEGTV